jgi:hypothetical protein
MPGLAQKSRGANLRRYFLVEGILDGLAGESSIRAAFRVWDAQLGISALARSLADAGADRTTSKRDRKRVVRRAALETAFTRAAMGPGLWASDRARTTAPGTTRSRERPPTGACSTGSCPSRAYQENWCPRGDSNTRHAV